MPTDAPSAVTLVRSAALSDAAEYAYAATVPADARLIFLAGSCPLDQDGTTVGVGDVPSTLMGVTVLRYDDQLVEVEAVAAVVD
ncbi:hypothetical protein RDV89_02530 [Nocardioides zeae]|uniref:Uncharacterized protein n=1 Tax=Nocardioides imazamoxiresistens TaxID=3231893 RepID=A0ABU3PSV4_9ACTN|nr:hypothetical protein [Nocardioides zeae]MDT9591927.1 hypothetical protein [Nocardioides zeae]